MREPHPEISAAQLRTIASRILMLAEQQDHACSTEANSTNKSLFDEAVLARIAREELELRRSRRCFFEEDLFAEPAWDILLALFLADSDGGDLTTSLACAAAGVPRSTAVRYLDDLEARSLVMRYGCENDGRVMRFALTHQGRSKLLQTLRQYGAIRAEEGQVRVRPIGPPKLSII